MPEYLYQSRYDPPRWWEHVFAHPLDIVLAVFSICMGAGVGVALLPDCGSVAPAVELQPWPVQIVLAVAFVAGGALTIYGLFGRFRDVRDGAYVLRAAKLPQFLGFTILLWISFGNPGGVDWMDVALTGALAVGTLLGYLAGRVNSPRVVRIARQRRRAQQETRRFPEEM